jgi:hypothetical protein
LKAAKFAERFPHSQFQDEISLHRSASTIAAGGELRSEIEIAGRGAQIPWRKESSTEVSS